MTEMSTQAGDDPRILPKKLIKFVLDTLEAWAAFLVRMKFHPNTVTILSLLAAMAAGLFFALGRPVWAGIWILISGLFDVLDGKVADQVKKSSLFGAIFDSAVDRYAEFFLYLGLAYYFREHWALWITFFTFLGSTMVSYTRARAEGLGIDCKVGIMQRAERLVLIVLGAFIGAGFDFFDPLMIGILILIALVSNITAWQRTFYVRKVERKNQEVHPE